MDYLDSFFYLERDQFMINFLTDAITWLLESIWVFIEEFLKLIILGLSIALPSTPASLTLSALLTGYLEANDVFAWIVIQILQGLAGMLAIVLIYKGIKILPLV